MGLPVTIAGKVVAVAVLGLASAVDVAVEARDVKGPEVVGAGVPGCQTTSGEQWHSLAVPSTGSPNAALSQSTLAAASK